MPTSPSSPQAAVGAYQGASAFLYNIRTGFTVIQLTVFIQSYGILEFGNEFNGEVFLHANRSKSP
ncbi:hypothetical protein BIV60_11645 [Bacillus sp. MUM 116]|nr:hypothetical protein BIV60_11645 [Bacillus sp. MUM 116]